MATTLKRGRGRPPGKYVEVMAMLTPAQLEQLDQWARRHKTTHVAVMRQVVDELVGTVPVRGTTAEVPTGPQDLLALVQDLEARIAKIEARAKRK